MRRPLTVAVTLLCSAALAEAQTTSASGDQPSFRVETALVELSVVVVAPDRRPLVDLGVRDFEVTEDGVPREIVGFRRLGDAVSVPAATAATPNDARLEMVATNVGHRDAPIFVLLMDDLNTSPFNTHRAIRGGLGVLSALPPDALVAVVRTSGIDGAALTLSRKSANHVARVEAFRGQLLLAGPAQKPITLQTTPSAVGAPCGVGSAALQSQDCADPTRAERRARVLQAIGDALRLSGSRRKVIFWVTEDMGVSPITPNATRAAQRDALSSVLAADVAVYPVNPIGNMAHAPGADDEEPGDGRPDRRTGAKIAVGPGQFLEIDTDDLVAVTLNALAHETGGRWIRQIDQLDQELATVVRQNSASYLLTYTSTGSRIPGRHRVDVRVSRPDARVFARRGFIVAHAEDASSPPAGGPDVRLRSLLQRVVPQGDLALRVLVTPLLAEGRAGRAFLTIAVDRATAHGQDVEVALLTLDDDGVSGNQQGLRFSHASAGPWEASAELALSRGTHQLRVAASNADGTRDGLVVEHIEAAAPTRELYLGPSTVIVAGTSDAGATLCPTLQRTFETGHPLALQAEVAGRPVERGEVLVSASLRAADGTTVRLGSTRMDPGTTKDRARATMVIATDGLAPGAYSIVTEARAAAGAVPLRHAIPVTLVGGAPTTLVTIAHGPTSNFASGGEHVIRAPEAWQAFWSQLPTRQGPPDIDFARVTVLAIVLSGAPGQEPAIAETRVAGDTMVVRWRAQPAKPGVAVGPAGHPFVVVGVLDVMRRIRFERID